PEAEKQATLQGNRSFALNGEFSRVGFNTVKRGSAPAQVDDLLDVLALELQQAKAELEASKRSSHAETAAEAEENPRLYNARTSAHSDFYRNCSGYLAQRW